MNDYTSSVPNNKNAVYTNQEFYILHDIRVRETGKLIIEDSIVVVV